MHANFVKDVAKLWQAALSATEVVVVISAMTRKHPGLGKITNPATAIPLENPSLSLSDHQIMLYLPLIVNRLACHAPYPCLSTPLGA